MITKQFTQSALKLLKQAGSLNLILKNRFYSINDTSDLNEEQIAIQNMAFNFAKNKILPYATEWDENKTFPINVIKEAGELGFGGMYVNPNFGGAGLSRLTASLVYEALGASCIPTSVYISLHNTNCTIIEKFGTQEQKENILRNMVNFKYLSSFCLTEPNSGSDAGAMKTFAKKKGSDYIISGSKCFITCAGVSDYYFVMCLTGENQKSCILVPKDAQGLSFGQLEKKMGWKNSPTRIINFDNVIVPRTNLVGKEGEGFKIAMKGLDSGRLGVACASFGAAAYTFDKAKQYMNERKQFGQLLNQFQFLQFQLADMATELITARLLNRSAAMKIDKDHKDKTMYASMAKLFSTEKSYNIIDLALQVHGGIGYTVDGGIERYLRDQRVNRILEGSNEIQRLIISRHIIKNL